MQIDQLAALITNMDDTTRLYLRVKECSIYRVSIATPGEAIDFIAKMQQEAPDFIERVTEAELRPKKAGDPSYATAFLPLPI